MQFYFNVVNSRYSGPLLEPAALTEAVAKGPNSTEYTQLVSWLNDKLKDFYGLEESINATHCKSSSELKN